MRVLATTALATLALTLMPAAQAEAAPKKQAKAAQKTTAKTMRAAKSNKAIKPTRSSKAQAATKMQRVVVMKNGKRVVAMRRVPVVVAEPPRPSYGQLAGLHATQDPLDLKSSVAYVLDQDTNEILFQKNENAVLPIASLTKLMTAVIVSEAQLDPNEIITISEADVDTEKGSRSRLKVGTQLPRGELMLLSLMSSENRAAHALGRNYPGGLPRFVQAMNAKAKLLGMNDTRYSEPTGLSSRNQSSAKDLATLTSYAYNDKIIRELSVARDHQVVIDEKPLNYVNTNRLVRGSDWEIGLQKTGFISEAGQCLIMQAKISGRRLIMVFLDSAGKLSRLGDAERVRRWVEGQPAMMQKIGSAPAKQPG
ncbi:serine hydrolase [Variovorax sp. PCZ-1]|uniref:D-alanyl-D-alanine carboxypeptidase family protein n=1 Tax=Variovorax sp. PCZ-1 TaxID=2835533 RepID=UPI0020BE5946|nr:serine hydrolase [Variovorax sp. PCZ-1]